MLLQELNLNVSTEDLLRKGVYIRGLVRHVGKRRDSCQRQVGMGGEHCRDDRHLDPLGTTIL
jgi:hypothetical protein